MWLCKWSCMNTIYRVAACILNCRLVILLLMLSEKNKYRSFKVSFESSEFSRNETNDDRKVIKCEIRLYLLLSCIGVSILMHNMFLLLLLLPFVLISKMYTLQIYYWIVNNKYLRKEKIEIPDVLTYAL